MYNKTHKRPGLHSRSPVTDTKRIYWQSLIALPFLLLPLHNSLAAIPAEWKNTAYSEPPS